MLSSVLLSSSLFLLVFSSKLDNVEAGDQTGYPMAPGDIKRMTLKSDTLHEFLVTLNITSNKQWEGFIFQAHTQRNEITLSESPNLVYGKYTVGTNIGLWRALSDDSVMTYTYYVNVSCSMSCDEENQEDVPVLVAVTTADVGAPIPGGCTMTSALETDPNIKLTYSAYTTTVYYENGNIGYNPYQGYPHSCTDKPADSERPAYQDVQYSVYHKVLPIGNYHTDKMFDAIEDLLTASSISKNKDDLPNFKMSSTGVKKATIDSYEGDGVVYNVLSFSDEEGASFTAYVPAVTYACKFTAGQSTCKKDLQIVDMVVGPFICLVGLFLVLAAHRLFHVEVYVFSSLISVFLWYIAVINISTSSTTGVNALVVRLSIALVLSLLSGGLVFMFWFFSGWYLPCVLLFTASAGFLLTAALMYVFSFTVVDSLALLKIGYVYFLLYGCLIVLVMIPAVIFPRALNIISSVAVGSYLVVFGLGTFVFTSLTEVLMRVVKNATVRGYMKSEASYPFQRNDFILSGVWIILIVVGIIVQSLLAYKREPFPKTSPYKQCLSRIKKKRRALGSTADERKKLMDSYCNSPTHFNS